MREARRSSALGSCVLSCLLPIALIACGDAGDPAAAPRVGVEGGSCDDGAEETCQRPGLPLDMLCLPGALALADGGCRPAGVPPEACGDGFEPDGDRGCRAILPDEVCPAGEMAIPGEARCRDVAPCADGRWGDIPVEAGTQYVDEAYAGGFSDGSPERPWRTIQEGVAAAAPGAVVAVAQGLYQEDVVLIDKSVRLRGRCPSLVGVRGTGVEDGTIAILGRAASRTEVRGLAITGPAVGVGVVGASAVVLDQLWIHDTGNIGVLVLRTPGAPAAVSITRSLIATSVFAGIANEGSDVNVEGTVVRGVMSSASSGAAGGILTKLGRADERGSLSLHRSVVADNHTAGVLVSGGDAFIASTVVHGTRPAPESASSYGIAVKNNAAERPTTLALAASILSENAGAGLVVWGAQAAVDATVVRDTLDLGPRDANVAGVVVQTDPDTSARGGLAVRASLLSQNRNVGLVAVGSDATVDATVVRGTSAMPNGIGGEGVRAQADARTGEIGRLALESSLIERNTNVGVFVIGGDAVIRSTVVRTSLPDGAGLGRGVNVQPHLDLGRRSTLSIQSSLIEDNHDIGVLVTGADATIETSVVRGTQPTPHRNGMGDGISVLDEHGQGTTTVTATQVEGNDRAGLYFANSGGQLHRVAATGNRFGLVRCGETKPTVGDGNHFAGNEQDRVEGGELAVPSSVPPRP